MGWVDNEYMILCAVVTSYGIDKTRLERNVSLISFSHQADRCEFNVIISPRTNNALYQTHKF